MQFNQLNKISEAPGTGYLLVYFRTGVEFGSYKQDGSKICACFLDKYEEDQLLEIHLFDDESEYRAIRTKSGMFIECLINDELIKADLTNEGPMDTFVEYPLFYGEAVEWTNTDIKQDKITLLDHYVPKTFYFHITEEQLKRAYEDKKGLCLKVVNYLQYDENDMIEIPVYRLAGLYIGKEERLNG